MTNLIDSTQELLLKRFTEGDLNELENDQVSAILKRLVNGTLSEQDSDKVLSILGDSEKGLDFLDSIWMEQPVVIALANTPNLELEASERIRKGVVKRIRMSNTMGATVRLGTAGFGSVASTILKPLIKKNKWESRRQKRRM